MVTAAETRFFDSRERYRMFVSTTTEKWHVAQRIGRELELISPGPGAFRVFDAGLGDGTVLDHVLRNIHVRFKHVPVVVVGKEISLEDARQSITRMADRFQEHPEFVMVLTNMLYREAPELEPSTPEKKKALQFTEVALDGDSAYEFEQQIRTMDSQLAEDWQVKTSEKTGNPLYHHPSVTVVYRKDREFLLRPVMPEIGNWLGEYDLVIASQPYRARTSPEFKVKNVIAPLACSLAPGGRLIAIQSYGNDPGMEIVNAVWPEEKPFAFNRHAIFDEARKQMTDAESLGLEFLSMPDADALFNYKLHTMAADLGDNIGTSLSMAAWNAAVYVAQMDDDRISEAMADGKYLDTVHEVLKRHGGLWFNDESYVIARQRS